MCATCPDETRVRQGSKSDKFKQMGMSKGEFLKVRGHVFAFACLAPLVGLCAVRTFCNPMSIPDMPIGIECWKFNEGDVIHKDKLPPWAYGCWHGGMRETKIAHQFRELADPEIHVFDGVWYLYPSCGLLWRSHDSGGTWEHVNLESHNPNYAPTVTEFRGKYYLAESHVNRGLLVGDSPSGPFKPLGRFDTKSFASVEDPAVNFGDPMLFADGDRLYVYLGCVAKQNCLWGAELDPDNPLRALAPARRLVWFDKAARPWMRGPLEGAYVFKRGDSYYFTHAGNSPKTGAYATSVWKGPTPLGPFSPQANNPVFSHGEPSCAVGGGHGGIFQDESGDWWTCYTIWPRGEKFHAFERFIGLDRIAFDEKGDVVPSEPTDEPQWLTSSGRRGPTGWKALPARTEAKNAADGRLRTYEKFADAKRTMTFEFAGERMLRAFRLIWCDLGLDVHRGSRPGPYRYLIECRSGGMWRLWVDASQNAIDLTVDYREAQAVKADAVRLVCLATPKGLVPAVTEFTVFGN